MARRETQLRLYGAGSAQPRLAWTWVDEQIARAGTYWVDARTEGHPHPRPVWGVWYEQRLHLSVGSPVLSGAMSEHAAVTVHLESGTEVVIIEGLVAAAVETSAAVIEAYNRKYDWDYQVDRYGHLSIVQPSTVLAWRTAGWAGRESFQSTGRWVYDDPR